MKKISDIYLYILISTYLVVLLIKCKIVDKKTIIHIYIYRQSCLSVLYIHNSEIHSKYLKTWSFILINL